MPRAVIIAVGDLSLHPIKSLVEEHSISCDIVTVTDAETLKSIDSFGKNKHDEGKQADCIFVHAQDDVFKHSKAFSSVETLLVYSTPETYLAQQLANTEANSKSQSHIQKWTVNLSDALKVAEKNKEIKLCSLDDILQQPKAFIEIFSDKKYGDKIKASEPDLIQQAFLLSASAELIDYDELYEIYDNALSAGTLIGDFSVHLSPDSDLFKSKCNDLKSIAIALRDQYFSIVRFEETIERYKKELVKMESEVKENKEKSLQANEKLKQKCNSLNSLERTLTQKSELFEKVNESLRATAAELEAKTRDCSEQSKEKSRLAQKVTSLNNSLAGERDKLISIEKKLKDEIRRSNESSLNAEKKEADLAEATCKINDLESTLDLKNKECDKVASDRGELKEKVNSLEDELEKQENEIALLVKRLEEEERKAADKASSAAKSLECAQDRINELSTQLDLKCQELTESKESIALKDDELAKLNTKFINTTVKLKSTRDELVAEIKKLEKEAISNNNAFQFLKENNIKTQNQLDLEIESSKAKSESIKSIRASHDSEVSRLNNLIEISQEENKLCSLQIEQLQEELESYHSRVAKLLRVDRDLVEANLRNEELIQELRIISSEKKAADLEIASLSGKQKIIDGLNKERESLSLQLEKLTQEVKSAKNTEQDRLMLIAELEGRIELSQQKVVELQSANAELNRKIQSNYEDERKKMNCKSTEIELASLQIRQLQEELECYYQAYQEIQHTGKSALTMTNRKQNIFSKASLAGIKVVGKYLEDDYKDLHISMDAFNLGNGKSYPELLVKIINVCGCVGVEIRDSEDGSLFRHFDDSKDEYGPYLRYFSEPSDSLLSEQEAILGRMNASERLLVFSCINVLSESLQQADIDTFVTLSNDEWREWRLAITYLTESVASLPVWLSFDSVSLKEEYRSEGYEHLWIVFNNLLVGSSWQGQLELKLAATELTEDSESCFSKNIALEFRELDDGSGPLLTWPPETADEFGPKLLVSLDKISDCSELATADYKMITHISNNLPSIVDKLRDENAAMTRNKEDWIAAINRLLQKRIEDTDVLVDADLVLDEVVSMGSYQHLLFECTSIDTKVKVKAQNINPDTFDAEIYIELRNGHDDVIYSDTQYFGEDEFGPRVLIPAELLFGADLLSEKEFEWLLNVYTDIKKQLESSEDIDELTRRMWLNMIERKVSIS